VVQQVLLLETHPHAAGEVFNVGNDQEISILELARRIVALCGSASEVTSVPYPQGYGVAFEDVRRRVPDLSKIRSCLGSLPETDLQVLIERTLASVRSEAASTQPAGAHRARP
jgi:UDP-glucose 4-epimerase